MSPKKTADKQSTQNLNATAYRIFKVLQWLGEGPLNVDELNARLLGDPAIGKSLSSDSLWLYINTLRALGCQIQRPGKRNGFRYTLMAHPFGLNASDDDLDLLVALQQQLEPVLDYQDMLSMEALFTKMLSGQPERLQAYYRHSRSVCYSDRQPLIAVLEKAAGDGQLLAITYQSPRRGKERFYYLPETLFYRNGTLFVRGERHPAMAEATLLRVDRMLAAEPFRDEAMRKALLNHRQQFSGVTLHFYADGPESVNDIDDFGLNEKRQWQDDYLKMTVQTRDWFTLRQKILETGIPIGVVEPESFRQSLAEALTEIGQRYADADDHNDHHDDRGGNGNDG